MSAFLTTVSIILQLVPALIAAIKAIEDAIPGTGKGEQKLAAIRDIISATSNGATEMWPIIEKTISVLVGLFNKTGQFRTSTSVD